MSSVSVHGPTEEVDVLVVGSGPAGSAYARTIGGLTPTVRLLMVEAGPGVPGIRGFSAHNMDPEEARTTRLATQGPDAGVDRIAEIERIAPGVAPGFFAQTNLPGLFFVDPCPELGPGEFGMPAASMASGVGGMGIYWATLCPRPAQSERIPFISESEMDEALGHAESLLHVRKHEECEGLSGALRKVLAAEFDGDGLMPVGFVPTASRWEGARMLASGTDVVLGDLESSVPAFELRGETLARRVLTKTGRVLGAELEDLATGRRYEVRASHVVVCGDGLRTAQLLFASDVRPRALGRYLNDHLKMASQAVLSDEFDPSGFPRLPEEPIVLIPYSDARPYEGVVVPMAGRPMSSPGSDAAGRSGGGSSSRHLAAVAFYGAKEIQVSDRIEFSGTEVDFYGMPKMSIRYSLTDRDRDTIRRMEESMRVAAARVGTLLHEPRLAPGGASLHYQGAVRMGMFDDGTSVCDPFSRVWGVEGLSVGGNGVIPTMTAANPTLTAVALAWRGAQGVVERLRTL